MNEYRKGKEISRKNKIGYCNSPSVGNASCHFPFYKIDTVGRATSFTSGRPAIFIKIVLDVGRLSLEIDIYSRKWYIIVTTEMEVLKNV